MNGNFGLANKRDPPFWLCQKNFIRIFFAGHTEREGGREGGRERRARKTHTHTHTHIHKEAAAVDNTADDRVHSRCHRVDRHCCHSLFLLTSNSVRRRKAEKFFFLSLSLPVTRVGVVDDAEDDGMRLEAR